MKAVFNNKKNVMLIIVGTLLVISLGIGASYAYWRLTYQQNNANKAQTKCLKINLTNETEAIQLESAYPISDSEGEKLDPYTFEVENLCDNALNYAVNLQVLETEEQLDTKNVAIQFDEENKKILNLYSEVEAVEQEENVIKNYQLFSGVVREKSRVKHSLRMWLDESADNSAQNKQFLSKINISATIPTENLNTPHIEISRGDTVLQTIEASEGNQEFIFYSKTDVTVKLSGKENDEFYYSDTGDTESKTVVSENQLNITPTPEGTSKYFYVGDSLSYIKITVITEEISPPAITVDSAEFAKSHQVSIASQGNATSEVDYYEYFISDSENMPEEIDEKLIKTTKDGLVTISEEGTHYLFYRTVGKSGIKSEWSTPQIVNVYYQSSSVSYTNEHDESITNMQEALDKIFSFIKE